MKRIIMAVTAAKQIIANAYMASTAYDNPDVAEDQTFEVGLSADGNEPATYYVAMITVKDNEATRILAKAGNIAGAWAYENTIENKQWLRDRIAAKGLKLITSTE